MCGGSAEPPKAPRASRDTLNPKTPLCSCRSLLSSVLFPAPDGPLRTTGLGPDMPVGDDGDLAADPRERGGCSHTHPQLAPGTGRSWKRFSNPGCTFLKGRLHGDTNTRPAPLSTLTPPGEPGLLLLGGEHLGPHPCVSWHHAPEADKVKVNGTQALFWELPSGSEGPTLRNHSFLTPLLSDTVWKACRKVVVVPSQPTAQGSDTCHRGEHEGDFAGQGPRQLCVRLTLPAPP